MPEDPDELMSEADTARMLHTSVRSLRRWRHDGTGPPSVKVGRRVLYRRGSVLAWLREKERGPANRRGPEE